MNDRHVTVPIRQITAPLLVGREREQALLHTCLNDVVAGHGGLVLIGGEAGIGKTALVEALCREAGERGALMLAGRCFDLSDTPPYGPWLELFARYHPEDGFPALPDAFVARNTARAAASQMALFQQVNEFIVAVAARAPLLLFLDDIHWSDPTSLDLLRAVARQVTDLQLLVIATYRGDELTRMHPLTPLVPVLVREAAAIRINLHRLHHADVRSYVAARYPLPDEGVTRLVTYLYDRSEGNPLFLGELVRTLEEEEIVHWRDDRWHVGDLTYVRIPALLRHVIDGRLARLGAEAQEALALGAVIGQDVPLALWKTVAGIDADMALDMTERARDARIVEESPDGMQIRFAHALIREALYESIAPSRRRLWHQRIADTLAAQHQPDPDAVAYHFRQAGDARAAEWLVRAGERAERAFAWLTAADRFEAATTLMRASGERENERGWLLCRQATLLRYTNPQQGISLLEEAEQIAASSHDGNLMARVLLFQGLARCYAGDLGRGLPQMEAGIAAFEAITPFENLQRIGFGTIDVTTDRGTLVLWLACAGRFAEARAIGEQYLAHATPHTVEGAQNPLFADMYLGLALAYAHQGEADQARRAHTLTQRAARAVGHFIIVSGSMIYELSEVVLPYHADEPAERERLVSEAEKVWARASDARADFGMRFPRLPSLILDGEWEEARTLAETALAHTGTSTLRAIASVCLGDLAYRCGETALGWSLVRAWMPGGPQTPPGTTNYHAAAGLQRLAIAIALDEGDQSASYAWLGAHDALLAWSGAVLGQTERQLLWAQYYRAAGNVEEANARAEDALRSARTPHQPLALLAAHRLLGELHTEAGRFDAAAMHLNASRTLADACAAPYERALTLLASAVLHAMTGDHVAARIALDDVRTVCARLGAKPILARANALAERLKLAGIPAPAYPAGLTAREVEVLRLVADGHTNQEIADLLCLSRHTVMNHVAHIMAKTNADNRAAAAAFGLRHNIT